MRKTRMIHVLLIAFAATAVGVLFMAAEVGATIDTGFSRTISSSRGADTGGLTVHDPGTIATRVVSAALQFIGVIFLIVLIIAGFMWMTAGGNEEKIGKAKKMIVGSVIGIAVVFGSYTITEVIFTGIGAGLSLEERQEDCLTASDSPDGGLNFEYDADCMAQACLANHGGTIPNCPEGQFFNLAACRCEDSPDAPEEGDIPPDPAETCPSPPTCIEGQRVDLTTCSCVSN